MRLTNTLRDAFIRAVMQDVPHVDYDEQISKAFRAAAENALPAKVRALLKDPACEPYINFEYRSTKSMRSNMHVPAPRQTNQFALPQSVVDQIDALIDANCAQAQQRDSLQAKLRAVAYSVSTRKALVEALPEFEKYLPADAPAAVRSLPVVANVVTDFVKAGWPKKGGAA